MPETFNVLELSFNKPFIFDLVFDLVNNIPEQIFALPIERRDY